MCFTVSWATLIVAALSVWEYVITFDQEVSTVWQATRFSGSSLLLLVTRYGMLIEVLVQLLRGVLGISVRRKFLHLKFFLLIDNRGPYSCRIVSAEELDLCLVAKCL